jgi:hypothetical protein
MVLLVPFISAISAAAAAAAVAAKGLRVRKKVSLPETPP